MCASFLICPSACRQIGTLMCAISLTCLFSFSDHQCRSFQYTIPDSLSRAAYFGPGEDSTNHQRRKVGPSEVMHIREVASEEWGNFDEDLTDMTVRKMRRTLSSRGWKDHCSVVCAHLYVPFDCDLASSLQGQVFVAFPSCRETYSRTTSRTALHVHTRSDFLIAKSTPPRLLVSLL